MTCSRPNSRLSSRWRVGPVSGRGRATIMDEDRSRHILTVNDEDGDAVAERIALCHNACLGVPLEVLRHMNDIGETFTEIISNSVAAGIEAYVLGAVK